MYSKGGTGVILFWKAEEPKPKKLVPIIFDDCFCVLLMICPVTLACHLDNSILYIKYTLTYLVFTSLTVGDILPTGYHKISSIPTALIIKSAYYWWTGRMRIS